MAINIKFDLSNNPELPTLILSTKNGAKIGVLDANHITIKDTFAEVSEISFEINKYTDGKLNHLWDRVKDFLLLYCLEWNLWFEIRVEINESIETTKIVHCTQLGQAELSQIMIYNKEINTEDDISRDDYEITVLYDEKNPSGSLLHRLLEKAPHYSVIHVDNTIADIQRTFSFNDISIYDAFQEVSETLGCIFIFHSNSDKYGNIQRTISVYDLMQNCPSCGHRGEFMDTCPKCGNTEIKMGYGEDTTIFITADELADNIELSSDNDAVKNCFYLEAGDDLMTATIRNCNPNGSNYIWRFSEDMYENMSQSLVDKLKTYNDLYQNYYSNYVSNLDNTLLDAYNSLVNKYYTYNKQLETIASPITGYSYLMHAYYNTIDFSLFLNSSMMPSPEINETTAAKQAAILTTASLSPTAVSNISDIRAVSLATANSAILAIAKITVDPDYKVEIKSSTLSGLSSDGTYKTWTGNFIVTNHFDETDVATSTTISVEVNTDNGTFINQKIIKSLTANNTDKLSISGLFASNDFVSEIKKYSLDSLLSFKDACQACLDILIEQGIADNKTWSTGEENLYEDLYLPYYNKLQEIVLQIQYIEAEIETINKLQDNIIELKEYIQSELDFEKYLGNDLWLEFCSFRREDKFSDNNYISDGLDNAELFSRALEFFEIAENEIYKASELQHSISTSLNNLLSHVKFAPILNYFNVGNWIRILIDDTVYKLRLLDYTVDYDDIDKIKVNFSDVTKIRDGITDVQNVLSRASAMAASYNQTKRHADQGAKSNSILDEWFDSGVDATNTKIIGGADNQSQVWDGHGILCRRWNSITNSFDDIQLKIINSTMAITDDNWKTTKTAVGNFYYIDPITNEIKNAYGINGEVIIGRLLIGESLGIYNESGTLTFDKDGFVVTNGINTITIDPNDKSVFNIKNNTGNVVSFDEDGDLVIIGNITAKNLTLLDGTQISSAHISGLSDVALSGDYADLENTPQLAKVAISGSYNDLIDKIDFDDIESISNDEIDVMLSQFL